MLKPQYNPFHFSPFFQVKVTTHTICESQLPYIDILKNQDRNKNVCRSYNNFFIKFDHRFKLFNLLC